VIEKLQSHYGFTKTPFGRALAPGMLDDNLGGRLKSTAQAVQLGLRRAERCRGNECGLAHHSDLLPGCLPNCPNCNVWVRRVSMRGPPA